ncbi:DUF362 domain-containing protein [bacterium]|nr:DUF362 domain-containing protein [bacterium]
MVSRRDFLKTASAVSGLGLTGTLYALDSRYQDSSGFFGVHPFIESHPEAVFIMKTTVDTKTNSDAKRLAGVDFGRSVLIPKSESDGGIPLTYNIPIKPNLTCRGKWMKGYTTEGTMGVVTDSFFVEGIIESMKELGFSGSQFFIREVNCFEDFAEGGYIDLGKRTGAEVRDLEAKVGEISANNLQWMDVPEGVWFTRIPYLWPINAPDSFLINVAKFKAHGMGLTLCAKNLQGTIAHNYQEHCTSFGSSMDMSSSHRNPNAQTDIRNNYNRHVADGIPRWDKPGNSTNAGLGMETWASRCLDNNSVTKPGIHIIEGIYGRDGNFVEGPNPQGLATDYMTNIVIFGKNPFYTDIIGHWLGGHEPGNFGLFHMAIERGLAEVLDPMRIPVYEWTPDGSAKLTPLTDFERTPLLTYYIQRDYNGQTEPQWHLVNEPYDYGTITDVKTPGKPEVFILGQNYPNPFNPNTSIEFVLPSNGYARLEIYNTSGQLVDVLANGYYQAGSHMSVWNTGNYSSGTYFYRLLFGGFSETKRMVLLK